jgi:glucose dehydrogenase
MALNAQTGQHLWHVQLGAAIYSAAVTYEYEGKQYVVIPSGAAIFAFALEQR